MQSENPWYIEAAELAGMPPQAAEAWLGLIQWGEPQIPPVGKDAED
jgi:hypothetical protein